MGSFTRLHLLLWGAALLTDYVALSEEAPVGTTWMFSKRGLRPANRRRPWLWTDFTRPAARGWRLGPENPSGRSFFGASRSRIPNRSPAHLGLGQPWLPLGLCPVNSFWNVDGREWEGRRLFLFSRLGRSIGELIRYRLIFGLSIQVLKKLRVLFPRRTLG